MSQFLTPNELADRWKYSPGTLANRRSRGDGPTYIIAGGKVLYPLEEIEKYEKDVRNKGR